MLIVLTCLVVILAGLSFAASLMVPFLLAVFLAVILSPPYAYMKINGVPGWIALIVMVAGLFGIGFVAVTVLQVSLDEFVGKLPEYRTSLEQQFAAIWPWLESLGIEEPERLVTDAIKPQEAMGYVGAIARALSGILGQTFIILIVVAFMLVEGAGLQRKLHAIPNLPEDALENLEQNLQDMRRYVSMKALMSLLTGLCVILWLQFLGVDNALFMGLLAFFLNFVPTLGSIIASVPGILLAFITFGFPTAGVCAVGYVVINVGISNVLEPRFMGYGLGISPLVVILSMIFWGWLLGPIGMLLSVPLTMGLKAILQSSSATRPIAILMGLPPRDGEAEEPGQPG
jgi:predicted PurR-regulated permease PerM